MLALTRPAAWLLALGLAAALHAAVSQGLAAALRAAPGAAPPLPRPAMVVRSIATASQPTPATPLTTALPALTTAPAGPPASFAPQPAGSLADAPRGPEFLASEEVDEPARPLTGWTMDAEDLSSLGITRVVFDAWVDEHASLVGLRVLRLEPATRADLAPLVEARLAGTPMAAALKRGRPVAHQQRIDLTWERAPQPPGSNPG